MENRDIQRDYKRIVKDERRKEEQFLVIDPGPSFRIFLRDEHSVALIGNRIGEFLIEGGESRRYMACHLAQYLE